MLLYRFLFLLPILFLSSCKVLPEKINGVSFVATPSTVSQKNIAPLTTLHANYCAIMPFGFIENINHPSILHNQGRQWFGETSIGAQQYISELRKQAIRIMIKPQIWVWRGEYTGHIKMNSEENWKILETSYTDFIITYATIAEKVDAEIFCIGTELENFIKYRPNYWKELIPKIRKVYSGKLTYAANWDEYKRIPFWKDLDYIGIDAYFPVSEMKTPSVADCLEGWKQHKPEIKALAERYTKLILFTEYGYRSINYTGKEPWNSDSEKGNINLEAQMHATQALLETFWEEPWFAGGFLWKWFPTHEKAGGVGNNQFTPQNKPTETILQKFYTK